MQPVIESIREWFIQCPLLDENYPLGVDYLPDVRSYSIDTLPTTPVYKKYVDGGKLYQYDFTFTSKESFDGDTRTMIDNSEFYRSLSEWVETMSREGSLPNIDGHHSCWIEETTHGYLFTADTDLARYQAQFKLIYK